MRGYAHQKWVDLYQAAMLELEHSLMADRLADARAAIIKRVAKLREIPGLHREERQAIEDALNGLRMLEHEEIGYTAEQQRKVARSALENLRTIRPKIERLASQQGDEG